MQSLLIVLLVAFPVAILAQDDLFCKYEKPNVPTTWISMDDICIIAVRELLNQELAIATQYLALAAFHYRTVVSRIGVAEVFISSAHHHRSNTKRLIDYLTMRGQNVNQINSLIQLSYEPEVLEWENMVEALKFALKLEGEATDRFRNVIGVCENQSFNDYNLVNWLTKEYLYTQYDDMKFYADTLSSLMKTTATNGFYGDFLIDVGFENDYCD